MNKKVIQKKYMLFILCVFMYFVLSGLSCVCAYSETQIITQVQHFIMQSRGSIL